MNKPKNMYTLSTEPIEQAEIEQDPKKIILDTAIALAQYRQNTSGQSRKYQHIQENVLNELYSEGFRYSNDIRECQPGVMLESLFFLNMRQLGLQISPSTGRDDMNGIDFYISDRAIPVDVTSNSNPNIISQKLARGTSTIIFIPSFLQQHTIKQFRGKESILEAFLTNKITSNRYLQIMLTLNAEFKSILTENLTHKYKNHSDFRLNKVKNKDISKLDNTLHILSGCFK